MKFIYSVFDSKAEIWTQPVMFESHAQAMRSFTTMVLQPENDFHNFAEDFCLFELGEFDEVAGTFNILEQPKSVVMAQAIKAKALKAKE